MGDEVHFTVAGFHGPALIRAAAEQARAELGRDDADIVVTFASDGVYHVDAVCPDDDPEC